MAEISIIDNNDLKWHHFDDPDDPELVVLAAYYGLHELALEDCNSTTSRAKFDDYGKHVFVVLNAPQFGAGDVLLENRLCVFIGDGFAVSVCDGANKAVTHVKAVVSSEWIWNRTARDILYLLMDYVCDQFLPTIDDISEEIADLEERVYENPDQEISRRATILKKVLTTLRRSATSHREIINQLLRRNPPIIEAPLNLYFRDIYDHLVQATDLIETDRDLLGGIIDTNMQATAHRTNEIVKMLTVYAAVLLPLNCVTAYFGMNFDFLPLIHDKWGPPIISLILIGMVVGSALYFRRRDW